MYRNVKPDKISQESQRGAVLIPTQAADVRAIAPR